MVYEQYAEYYLLSLLIFLVFNFHLAKIFACYDDNFFVFSHAHYIKVFPKYIRIPNFLKSNLSRKCKINVV